MSPKPHVLPDFAQIGVWGTQTSKERPDELVDRKRLDLYVIEE
jgi:hypothetical protein